jgi:hypothetical protein
MIIEDEVYMMMAPHSLGKCEEQCKNTCDDENCADFPTFTLAAVTRETLIMVSKTGSSDRNVNFTHVCDNHFISMSAHLSEIILNMYKEGDDD